MSRPESVSSRTATTGSRSAIWRISLRLRSPPAEALVQVAPHERRRPSRAAPSTRAAHADLEHREVVPLRRPSPGAGTGDRDPLDGLGVLEGEEQPGLGPHVGGPAVTSSPFSRMPPARDPCTPGWPSRAPARVDLPAPFGPMRAWSSPAPTARSTPRRISPSSAEAWRSSTSRAGESLSSLKAYRFGQVSDRPAPHLAAALTSRGRPIPGGEAIRCPPWWKSRARAGRACRASNAAKMPALDRRDDGSGSRRPRTRCCPARREEGVAA